MYSLWSRSSCGFMDRFNCNTSPRCCGDRPRLTCCFPWRRGSTPPPPPPLALHLPAEVRLRQVAGILWGERTSQWERLSPQHNDTLPSVHRISFYARKCRHCNYYLQQLCFLIQRQSASPSAKWKYACEVCRPKRKKKRQRFNNYNICSFYRLANKIQARRFLFSLPDTYIYLHTSQYMHLMTSKNVMKIRYNLIIPAT